MVTKYPLLRPAIAMALGIVLASLLTLDWRLGFGSAALIGFAACLLKRQTVLLGCAFWFFVGASLLSFRYAPRDPTDLRRIIGDQPELVTVIGKLSEDPEHRVLEQDRRTRYRTTARVSVEQIKRDDASIAACGDVAISTPGFTSDDFLSGTRVEIQGVLERPRGPLAPGL